MANLEVHFEEGTYEIVDGSYHKLDENHGDENDTEAIEYLDLDMEVVEAVSESTDYLSVEETQESITSKYRPVITPKSQPTTNIKSCGSGNTDKKSKSTEELQEQEKIHVDSRFLRIEETDASYKNGNRDMGRILDIRKRKSVHNGVNDDSPTVIDCPRVKSVLKFDGDSLDLFFRSMAQTVLNLPPNVQAKIKMDICKVISMAEIKYCSSENQRLNKK